MKAHVLPVLMALGACDLGLGSDPAGVPPLPCVAGHVREAAGCRLPRAAIAADGDVADWAVLPEVGITAECVFAPCDTRPIAVRLAGLGPAGGPPTALAFQARLEGTPPRDIPDLRVTLALEAVPERPAAAARDRLALGTEGATYEKNGFVVSSLAPSPPYAIAFTPDGFEAVVGDEWLTLQGIARATLTVERFDGKDWRAVAPTPPMGVCWGDGLPADACEVRLP